MRSLGSVRADLPLEEQFKARNQYHFDWLKKSRAHFVVKDFGHVYEKFIISASLHNSQIGGRPQVARLDFC